MSDLQDLSLVLYIFLVTETRDSNSSEKCETSFKDFLKSFFCDEEEVEVYIEEAKSRRGEIVTVYKNKKACENAYLTYSGDDLTTGDNLTVIKSYNDIKIDELNSSNNEKIRKLNSDINIITQLSNNNSFSGYALLASATISSKRECNAEENTKEIAEKIASKIILNIYNININQNTGISSTDSPNKLTEQSIKTKIDSNINHNTRISSTDSPNKLTEQSIKTKIGSIDLPTKSTTKQFIKLFSLAYGGEENKLYRSLILYLDQSEEFTVSYFYQIIPEILMCSYKVKYLYKCFEEHRKKIEEEFEEHRKKIEEEYKHKNMTHTTNNDENLRKDNTAQAISDLEKKLEHLEITYNNQYKLVNSLSQLVFAAEVNFRNIQRILRAHNIPRKLLFEYCFYETERIVETMKFYHHFHYKESDKIKSDIKTIETRSNILRNKLENVENRQSEIRNIILAIIAAIIAFFELVNDELVALLFVGIFGISLSATYIFIVKIVLAAFSLIIPILIYYKVRLGND